MQSEGKIINLHLIVIGFGVFKNYLHMDKANKTAFHLFG